MSDFIECNVSILVEKKNDRYLRIRKIAEADGCSIEDVVHAAVLSGINIHIDQNLHLMERGIENRRNRRTGG